MIRKTLYFIFILLIISLNLSILQVKAPDPNVIITPIDFKDIQVLAVNSEELFYDDGTVEYGWSSTYPVGAAVKFTPPSTPWVLNEIKIFGSYGRAETNELSDGIFYVEVWDSNHNELFHSSYKYSEYFLLLSGKWTIINIPDTTMTGDFYICVIPNWVQNSHILWIGLDNTPPNKGRSYWIDMNTNDIINFENWDFIIRAIGSQPSGVPEFTFPDAVYLFIAFIIGTFGIRKKIKSR